MKSKKVDLKIGKIEKILDEFDSHVDRKAEIGKQLDVAEEFLLNKKISEVDFYITVALNILSYSLAILILFISVPMLNGNIIYPFLIFAFSVLLLIFLIIYRRHKVDLLSVEFIKNKIYLIKLLQESDKIISKFRGEISNMVNR